MYETFYGLKEKPFSMIPDPEYLFLSTKHQRALTLLEYGMINQAGFSVICGDTGAGKTTLIRRLLNEMGDDTRVGLITNTHRAFGELLSWILMAFGLDPENKNKAQMHQMFISFLVEQYAQNKRTVLIVDEAQNMDADTLEELRMLSNINADKDQVLQVILAGQPALRETLRKPELMQFAQRIAVDYYLEALNRDETATYIRHRLKVAGASEEIFTDEACDAVYKYSGGTPRLINLLCDTSLVYGFAEQTKKISASLVDDVVREQHSSSVVPTYRKQQPGAEEVTSQPVAAVPETAAIEMPEKSDDNELKAAGIQGNTEIGSSENAEKIEQIKEEVNTGSTLDGVVKEAVSAAIKDDAEAEEKINDITEPEEADVTEENKSDVIEDEYLEAKSSTDESQENFDSGHFNDNYVNRNRRSSDLYPVVHVEDRKKSNFSGVVIGFSAGMFIASILLVVFVFMYGAKGMPGDSKDVLEVVTEKEIEFDVANSVAEAERLRVLQEERDKALAVSRALREKEMQR